MDEARRSAGPPTVAPWAVVVAGGLVALGVFLRVWLVSNTGVNSDEAVVGLMARQIQHGHFTTFFWGQAYGGVEPYVVAGAFEVFGFHTWLVEAVPAVLTAGGCVVLWRLASRVFSPTVGLLAASLAWAWPESNVRDSVQEYGFRGVVLLCGMTVLVCTVRVLAREDRRRTWALLGMATGVGWWASPEVLYFLVPAALGLAWAMARRPRRPWRTTAADWGTGTACAVLGALPWLYTNLTSHWPSLHVGTYFTGGTYGGRLGTFLTKTLPITLGVRTIASGSWLGRGAGPVLYGVVVIVVVLSAAVAAAKVPRARLLVAFLAVFPFLYAAQPTTYWRDGRFAVYFAPVVAAVVLGAVGYLAATARRPALPATRFAGAGLGAFALVAGSAAAVSSVQSLMLTTDFRARPVALGDQGVESAPQAVVRDLETHRITHVYAQYWVAYVVDLLSDGAVTATPPDAIRSRRLFEQVARAPRAAWLFTGPTAQDGQVLTASLSSAANPYDLTPAAFTATLDRRGVRSTTHVVGPMVAVLPSQQVTPQGLYRLETIGHL